MCADPLVRREAAKTLSRRLPMRGLWYFLYAYFLRRGFLDGCAGFRFCVMKAMYQQMVALKKMDLMRSRSAAPSKGTPACEKSRTLQRT